MLGCYWSIHFVYYNPFFLLTTLVHRAHYCNENSKALCGMAVLIKPWANPSHFFSGSRCAKLAIL
jgi:hypothetical protein